MNELEELKARLDRIEQEFRFHRHSGTDSGTLGLPDGIFKAPLNAVTAPSGGLTVDSEARSAINSIITRLEDLGLIQPN